LAENRQEKLQRGIEAARRGDRSTGRRLLREVVESDPDNELAWIWLASCMTTVDERRQCLRRVLEINPNNTRARQALVALEGQSGGDHVPAVRPAARTIPAQEETNRGGGIDVLNIAIVRLAVVAVGVGLNLATVALDNPLPSALTFGIAVTVGSFAYTRGRVKPVERLRRSWRRLLRLLPLTVACATLVGLAEAIQVNFWKNMAGAWLTAAMLTLAFALEASNQATRVRPNAGIRRSLDYAFGVSLGFGTGTVLLFGFLFEPYILSPLRAVPEHTGDPAIVVPVAVGLFVFTALFLIYGGFAVLMHGILRLWLAVRSPFGLSLQRPLGRAISLGLMRQVGGGYVFLHRTLLDHFADGPAGSARR